MAAIKKYLRKRKKKKRKDQPVNLSPGKILGKLGREKEEGKKTTLRQK